MSGAVQHAPYLTPDQVHSLNEKHGWFAYGDAQSDVSRAFAQDAIAMHERIRGAAQDMLIALRVALPVLEGEHDTEGARQHAEQLVRRAISKAEGRS
jgi:hypothetical protein